MTAPTIAPLNLALTAIREGHDIIRSGQTEPGLRLIKYGADYLEAFLPTPEPRIASELSIAADNLRKRAGAVSSRERLTRFTSHRSGEV